MSLNIEYNNRYQISKHDWKLNGNTITGYNYGHDSVGNRLYSENLVAASKSEHFVFDNADRLTSFKTGTLNANKDNIVTPTYSQSWNLDSIGNWAGFTDNGTSSTNTFSDTHEMTQFKGVANTFDNNGNLIFDGIRTFKYDAFNRIIEVKIGTIILAEYQYDAFNRRVMKKVDADLNGSFETTLKFLYDGFRCIEELNASDALVKEYVYGSLYIDEVILQRTGATDYYFTHDYRYSVTSLTNSAGNIVESYDYKVYGQRTASGSGLTDVGYTGQRHDAETGLMYFKNRYYSPDRGSFVTMDPLGFVDGMSRSLGYFGGQGRDPMGLFDNDDFPEGTSGHIIQLINGLPENQREEAINNQWKQYNEREAERERKKEEELKKSAVSNVDWSALLKGLVVDQLSSSSDISGSIRVPIGAFGFLDVEVEGSGKVLECAGEGGKKRKIVEVTISIKGKIGVGKVLNKKYYPPKMKPRNATDPTTGIKNKKLAGKQKPREKTQEGNSNYLGIQANNGGCPLCKVGINGMLEVGLGFEGGAFIYAEASVSQEWDPSKEFKFKYRNFKAVVG